MRKKLPAALTKKCTTCNHAHAAHKAGGCRMRIGKKTCGCKAVRA